MTPDEINQAVEKYTSEHRNIKNNQLDQLTQKKNDLEQARVKSSGYATLLYDQEIDKINKQLFNLHKDIAEQSHDEAIGAVQNSQVNNELDDLKTQLELAPNQAAKDLIQKRIDELSPKIPEVKQAQKFKQVLEGDYYKTVPFDKSKEFTEYALKSKETQDRFSFSKMVN